MKGTRNQTMIYSVPKFYRYIGRNGSGWQNGLEIWKINELDDRIYINPINSKNRISNCKIVIPKQNIQELINKLKTFL